MTRDIDKFARKLERILESKREDKRQHSRRTGIAPTTKAYHAGSAEGLRVAIAALQTAAERWKE